jgi:hypothetical protein
MDVVQIIHLKKVPLLDKVKGLTTGGVKLGLNMKTNKDIVIHNRSETHPVSTLLVVMGLRIIKMWIIIITIIALRLNTPNTTLNKSLHPSPNPNNAKHIHNTPLNFTTPFKPFKMTNEPVLLSKLALIIITKTMMAQVRDLVKGFNRRPIPRIIITKTSNNDLNNSLNIPTTNNTHNTPHKGSSNKLIMVQPVSIQINPNRKLTKSVQTLTCLMTANLTNNNNH